MLLCVCVLKSHGAGMPGSELCDTDLWPWGGVTLRMNNRKTTKKYRRRDTPNQPAGMEALRATIELIERTGKNGKRPQFAGSSENELRKML